MATYNDIKSIKFGSDTYVLSTDADTLDGKDSTSFVRTINLLDYSDGTTLIDGSTPFLTSILLNDDGDTSCINSSHFREDFGGYRFDCFMHFSGEGAIYSILGRYDLDDTKFYVIGYVNKLSGTLISPSFDLDNPVTSLGGENYDWWIQNIEKDFNENTATTSEDGLMSASDKTKLDGIDLSGYLPLTGGTLTGPLSISDSANYNHINLSGYSNRCDISFSTTGGSSARIGLDQNWGKGFIIQSTVNSTTSVLDICGSQFQYSPDNTNFYNILHSGNFIAGTNYVTPSGNITGSSNYLTVQDTRSTDSSTSDGTGKRIRADFKENSADSLSDGGTYHLNIGLQQWSDSSGGQTHNLGITDNGNMWIRSATVGGTWGTWNKFLHSGNFVAGTDYVTPSSLSTLNLNADTVDNYHIIDQVPYPYSESVTADFTNTIWYACVKFNKAWNDRVCHFSLQGKYDNHCGTVYLDIMNLSNDGWRSLEVPYNGDNILGIALNQNVEETDDSGNTHYYSYLYVKLNEYTAAYSWPPKPTFSINSAWEILDITTTTTAPSGITFTSVYNGSGITYTKWGASFADSATKATQDGNGNVISSTYLPLSGGTLSFSDGGKLSFEPTYSGTGGCISFYQNGFVSGYLDAGPLLINTRGGGNVGIGTSSPSYKLHVAGDSYSTGSSYATGFYQSSDIRYKDIQNNISLTSEEISELPIFDYTWNDNTDSEVHSGTSAQAVQEILPNLIEENKESGKLTLDYATLGTIIGISVARETKELKKKVNNLEEENKKLKDLISNLADRLSNLENKIK